MDTLLLGPLGTGRAPCVRELVAAGALGKTAPPHHVTGGDKDTDTHAAPAGRGSRSLPSSAAWLSVARVAVWPGQAKTLIQGPPSRKRPRTPLPPKGDPQAEH